MGINFCYQQLYAALTMFRQVKECDEAHLEDHLIQLAEELGEEISEDDGCYDDIDDNDYCNDDQT
jgi:hypothetical protein